MPELLKVPAAANATLQRRADRGPPIKMIENYVHKKVAETPSRSYRKRCNHYTLIVACMLSGASQDRPVIVGWSSAPRGQVIKESLGQLPKKLAAGPRVLGKDQSSRTQSRTKQGGPPHDHWAKLGNFGTLEASMLL